MVKRISHIFKDPIRLCGLTTFAIVSCLSLSGCFIAHEYYYEPEKLEGAEVRPGVCSGVGPVNTIVFKQDKLRLSVQTIFLDGVANSISYTANLSGAKSFEFVTSDFIVTSGEINTVKLERVDISGKDSSKEVDVADMGRLAFKSESDGWVAIWGFVELKHLKLNADKLKVTLPCLLIDDQRMCFKDIEFQKKSGVFVYPFNC